MKIINLVFVVIALLHFSYGDDYIINNKKFPDNFWFGCATSAYQIEGGWDADGKGESRWDNYTHQIPSPITDGSNGDIACDSYHQYETDVAMLKYLGVTHYRFSLSWPRILPDGLPESLNPAGVKYYKNLIKLLKDNGIIPLVTLYHWDTPLTLYAQGDLLADEFPSWFANYSRVCFEQFGDEVSWWTTFNEPTLSCGIFGQPSGYNEYDCGRNVLLAHAAAYRIYEKEFKETQGGNISIVFAISYSGPASNETEDIEAAERKMQFDMGWLANPIFNGDYPDVMKERAKERLTPLSDEEIAFINGTADYFCINTYGSYLAKNHPYDTPAPTRQYEESVDTLPNTNYPDGAWGLVPLAKWVQSHYNNPPLIMTENGFGVEESKDTLEDDNRLIVVQNYLSAIRDAIDEGVNFFGYTLWSLMDNFEWNAGYSRKFGIYHVDFDSENRTRTAKKSALWYKSVISTKCLVDNCVE